MRLFTGFVAAAAGLFALAIVLVLHGMLNPDEGFYLAAAGLVRGGLVPYRDFGYTQGPLLAYLNQPWLQAFGFNLAGQRIASLLWTSGMIAVGVCALRRKSAEWGSATVFVLLLLGAPLWLAFSVEGKTYGFAGLAVLTGCVSLLSSLRWPLKWLVFLSAAILGVGARYPVAGFFVPAGVGLLWLTPHWKGRMMATAAVVLIVAGASWVFVAKGAAESFRFWTIDFHHASTFRIPVWRHFTDCLRFAPVVWAVALGCVLRRTRGGAGHRPALPAVHEARGDSKQSKRAASVVVASLGIALLTNLAASTTYAEYVFPFIPAAAWMAAPNLAAYFARIGRGKRAAVVAVVLLAGWNYPPEFSPNLLVHAGEAEAFLKASVPKGAVVAASMPEIPVAAGCSLPPTMAMGKFGITEEMSERQAADRHMLTPSSLEAILLDPQTRAFVGSTSYNWNFFWSLPSYHVLSAPARASLWKTLRDHYELSFMNAEYVVYIRKN